MNFFRRRNSDTSKPTKENSKHFAFSAGHHSPNYNFQTNNNNKNNAIAAIIDKNDVKKPNKYILKNETECKKKEETDELKLNKSIKSNKSNKSLKSNKSNRSNSGIFHLRSTGSISNASIGISAHSIVSISNSALSLLDYNIERTDIESACIQLMDLIFDINAIWIVARPIDRPSLATRRFEHWCVKIHAQPALISMDFFESNGKGEFGISSVCASWTELEDFLTYYIVDYNSGKQIKKPWKILSSVIPKKYEKINNLEKHMLPLEIGKHNMSNKSNNNNNDHKIKCDYKVRDIAEFIEQWVVENKSYNSLGTNCQRFAYEVFNFLIGNYYPNKVKILQNYFQSPLDRQKEKLNRLKNNENPNLKSNEFIQHTSIQSNGNKSNTIQSNSIQTINIIQSNSIQSNKISDTNNPEPNVLVHSINFMDDDDDNLNISETEDID